MYQGGLLDTGGVVVLGCNLVPTVFSGVGRGISSVTGTGRRSAVLGRRLEVIGLIVVLGEGSSGAGQFQKGDRPKSISKSPVNKTNAINTNGTNHLKEWKAYLYFAVYGKWVRC